jgi:hypothetical protein
MSGSRKEYPDNSEIFARKAKGRLERARASFADKLDAMDEMKERVAPIVRAREARRQSRRQVGQI